MKSKVHQGGRYTGFFFWPENELNDVKLRIVFNLCDKQQIVEQKDFPSMKSWPLRPRYIRDLIHSTVAYKPPERKSKRWLLPNYSLFNDQHLQFKEA